MAGNLRVYISSPFDFGRSRQLVILRENVDETRPIGKYQGQVFSQGGNGTLRVDPIKEGDRIPPEHVFMDVSEQFMDEFLKAMAVELVRLGYVTGDPYGTRVKAVEDHLASMHKENDRKHDLITAMLAKIR